MYKIVYTKAAAKDVPKLKAAHLDSKVKALIEIIKVNPFRIHRRMKSSSATFRVCTPAGSTHSTAWCMKSLKKHRQ